MPDNALEHHNLAQIEALNQRGGRMLSVVDLLRAGTMNLEMAAFLCAVVGRGASFLSAAVPGGAGKTTVMAALLAFLPPDIEIVTVEDDGVIAGASSSGDGRRCYLAHEIGAGHFYGYIRGRAARDYLDLARRGHLIATGLHADTLPQLRGMLLSAPISANEQALAVLDFALFVAAQRRGSSVRRRVSVVHAGAGADAPLLFEWRNAADNFERHEDLDRYAPAQTRRALTVLLEDLAERKVHRLEDVRVAYLNFRSGGDVLR
jgi:hypothetical protein